MVNSCLQMFACILGCIGGVCVLITTFLPEWKINDSTDLDAIIRFEGLWTKCVTYPSGQWQCEHFDAFFVDLPNTLQIGRLFTGLAIFLGFSAFVASILGMECSTCFNSEKRMKFTMAITAGLLWVAAGICIGIAVSYYAYLVLSEYKKELPLEVADLGHKYIYGACLYLGWAGLVLCSVSGLMIGCSSRQNDDEWIPKLSNHTPKFGRFTKPFVNVEYV